MQLVYNKEEQNLVKACLKGKRQAQEKFYHRYATKMHGVCRLYTRDPDTASEMLQEGFIKVFRNLKQYDGRGSLEGWMRRTFVRVCIDVHRRNHHFRNQLELDEVSLRGRDDILEHNDALATMDKQDFLLVLKELPDGYRNIINLYVLEGYNHREIGELLHISEGTSKSQYSKARRFLKNIIGKYVDADVLERYERQSS